MTPANKKAFIEAQCQAIEFDIWKADTLASALTKAGLKDRAAAVAKESAEQTQLLKALRETKV